MSGFATRNHSSVYLNDDQGAFREEDVKAVAKRNNGLNGATEFRRLDFNLEDVQVNEIDIGQPCLDCPCPKGYKPHVWRKNCTNCKCSRDSHEVIVEHGARSRLGLTSSGDGLEPRSLGYSFVPLGLTSPRQVDKYYSTLPSHEVPRLGTKGEALRSQRLVRQLPKQDLSLTACKFVEQTYSSGYQDFVTARNEIALDIGIAKNAPPSSTCAGCGKALQSQLPCVSAPRMGNLLWHPSCFKCTTCSDLLVDLAYCVYDDNIYCERHYSENLKPRCASCDELLAFYTNVTRAVASGSTAPTGTNSDLSNVTHGYLKELNRERNRLLREIARLEGGEHSVPDPAKNITECNSVCAEAEVPRYVTELQDVPETPRNATDITVDRTELDTKKSDVSKLPNVLEDTSPIPLRDKHVSHLFPSYKDGSVKSKIELNTPSEDHPIIITDTNLHTTTLEEHDSVYGHREASPYPTYDNLAPRNSLGSEILDQVSVEEADEEDYKSRTPSVSQKSEEFLQSNFDNPEFWSNQQSLRPDRRSKSKSRSRSRTPEILRDDRLEFEQQVRSKSPALQLGPDIIYRRSKSEADVSGEAAVIVEQKYWKRSPSPFQKILDIYESSSSLDNIDNLDSVGGSPTGSSQLTITDIDEEVDAEVLNSVDGINKQKQSNEDNKRSFKNKKRNKRKGQEAKPATSLQKELSEEEAVSVDGNAVGGRKVDLEEMREQPGPSKRPGEPFWVKQK